MTDLIEQLENYGPHLDRAIGHPGPPVRAAEDTSELEPDEGELIVVDIQIPETERDQPDDKTGRKWLPYTIVAAAAVILVIVAVAMFDGSEESSTVDIVDSQLTEGEALGIVEGYYGAVESGDAEAITAVFVEPSGVAAEENLTLEVWNAGQGMVRVDRTCVASGGVSASVVVVCEYGDHQYLQRVVGAPATPITATFVVTADGIDELDLSYDAPLFPANDAFEPWMLANYPQDAAAAGCCGEGGSIEEARADGELRSRYADLWVIHLEQTGCTYTDIGC